MATISWLNILRVRFFQQLDRHLLNSLNSTYKQKTIRRNINISKKKEEEDNVSKEQVKATSESKITLLLSNNSMTVTYLEDAKKLAKRRNLILTKVENEQKISSRDTYKLVKLGDEFLEAKNNDKENNIIKAERNSKIKQIQISGKISTHDLNIKLKNVNKLLSKQHKIKFIINHDMETQDRILKYVETNVRQYGTIQKNVKSLYTTLIITPILNEDSNKNPSA
ncbi:translation initiation factor IF-3-like [Vespula squamosa]|uniref:Translation initiation factor IF-3-like n=1 Tax=Vespula squamosa TaxID=30214 RepID=A0ABD2A940_VESSQ